MDSILPTGIRASNKRVEILCTSTLIAMLLRWSDNGEPQKLNLKVAAQLTGPGPRTTKAECDVTTVGVLVIHASVVRAEKY